MSAALDNAYRSNRLRLVALVQQAAADSFQRLHNDRAATVAQLVTLADAGTRGTVTLVDAYMVATLREAGHPARARALDAQLYTTAALRGLPAEEVYDRPFGALAGQLEQGAEFSQALSSAQASVGRLVETDMQLAQTNAARDWMGSEERIVGYRRVLGGGDHCPLCRSASTRTYRKADLMPIHERCHCTVAPVFGREPVASVGTAVRVEHDPELGPRLVADDWSPTGPRLI